METEQPENIEETEPPFNKYTEDKDNLDTEETIEINGIEHPLRRKRLEIKNGREIKKSTTYFEEAADGRRLPREAFVAVSWTGLPIPSDCYKGKCKNPYDLHKKQRPVYIGEDGIEADEGNILCDDCEDLYKRKMDVLDWIPFFLRPLVFFFWEPEIL